MNNKNIKIGCEGFLVKGSSLLLGKRKNCYGEGTWALPGGHLEYGELLVEGIKRELKEELGIDCLDLRLFSVIDSIDEGGHYIHISFIIETYLGEIQNTEPEFCYEWKFFDIKSLPQELFKPHQKIITNYLNTLTR